MTSSKHRTPSETEPKGLTVTDDAKQELRRIHDGKSLDPGRFLRLAMAPVWEGEGDFGIVIGDEGYRDEAVEHQGLRLLLVDHGLAEQLSNAVLDFKDSAFALDIY